MREIRKRGTRSHRGKMSLAQDRTTQIRTFLDDALASSHQRVIESNSLLCGKPTHVIALMRVRPVAKPFLTQIKGR